LKIIRGEHVNEKAVIYFQTDRFSVRCLDECNVTIDIDGENGGSLPVDFAGIKFFVYDYSDEK
jgi:diacylglycerol kinase (ATP)